MQNEIEEETKQNKKKEQKKHARLSRHSYST
jgi:hypothetical protein